MDIVRVPPVDKLDQETFIRHMESRHADALKLDFKPLPGRAGQPRSLAAPLAWVTFHNRLHAQAEAAGADLGHIHGVPAPVRAPKKPLAIAAAPGTCRFEYLTSRTGHPLGIYCATHEKRGFIKWETVHSKVKGRKHA